MNRESGHKQQLFNQYKWSATQVWMVRPVLETSCMNHMKTNLIQTQQALITYQDVSFIYI